MATNTLCGYIKCTGKNYRNIGRWSWMQPEGEAGHQTRIVQAYVVGNNKSKQLGSTYQQSLRHIQTHGLNTTPKELMIEDLLRQLQIWKRQGDQILLMADANKHILTGSLGSALTSSKWDLGLEEVSHRAWGDKPPNTNIRGKDPINGVRPSSTLEVVGIKILSFYSSVGDHRGMVFDISARSLLGKYESRVVRAGCRRLISKKAGSVSKYNELFEEQIRRHKLRERLEKLDLAIGDEERLTK